MKNSSSSAGAEMPRFYVATYGDLGLEIEFYSDPLEYGRDIRTAARQHDNQEIDTYTYGSIPSFKESAI